MVDTTRSMNDTVAELMQAVTDVRDSLNDTMLVISAMVQQAGGEIRLPIQVIEDAGNVQVRWHFDAKTDQLVVAVKKKD